MLILDNCTHSFSFPTLCVQDTGVHLSLDAAGWRSLSLVGGGEGVTGSWFMLKKMMHPEHSHVCVSAV